MSARDADVIVVGGGPAGATTATLLARRGLDVLLLDKMAFPREKACAEYISPGAVALLARIGMLDDVAATRPAWLRGMRIHSARGRFDLSYDRGSAPYPALGISRLVLDQTLLDQALGAGVRVEERVRVRSALVVDGRVVGVTSESRSGPATVRAPIVVGADGIHSTVARSLGLDLSLHWPWPRRLGLVARFECPTMEADIGHMCVGRDGYCGIAPVGGGVVNVGLVSRLGGKPSGETIAAYFSRMIDAIPAASAQLAGSRRMTRIRGVGPLARRVRDAAGPGFLLVGDAAGFLDPFTGEGIYRALRGAELAVPSIEQALERGIAEPLGYREARESDFQDKERVCALVQGFLAAGQLFDYIVDRIERRSAINSVLSGILGDYEPAAPALRPRFLWSLLRP